MKKKISIMIPCYNEEENARPIYEAVKDELERELPGYDYEILFIDNKSTDGTRRIIEKICEENPKVKGIFNAKNFGQFNSPYYGILQTTGDCTISICFRFLSVSGKKDTRSSAASKPPARKIGLFIFCVLVIIRRLKK